jgi:Cysteine-rich CPXCG
MRAPAERHMISKTPSMNATLAADADRVYGLEPVLDTGHDGRFSPVQKFVGVLCPYCGGSYQTPIDLTLGAQQYIEDCQACCQAIELSIDVVSGVFKSVTERRIDGA